MYSWVTKNQIYPNIKDPSIFKVTLFQLASRIPYLSQVFYIVVLLFFFFKLLLAMMGEFYDEIDI